MVSGSRIGQSGLWCQDHAPNGLCCQDHTQKDSWGSGVRITHRTVGTLPSGSHTGQLGLCRQDHTQKDSWDSAVRITHRRTVGALVSGSHT